MVNKSQQVASQNLYEDISDDSVNKELRRKATAAARSRLYRARKKAEKRLDKKEVNIITQIVKLECGVPITQTPEAPTNTESLVNTSVAKSKETSFNSKRKWPSSAARLRDYRARKKLSDVNQVNKNLDETSASCGKTYRFKNGLKTTKHKATSVKRSNLNFNTTNEDILPCLEAESSNDHSSTSIKTIRDQPKNNHKGNPVEISYYCDVPKRQFNTNLTLESKKSLDSTFTREIPKESLQTCTQSPHVFDNNTSISSIAAKILGLLEQKIDNRTPDDDEAFFESLLPYMKSMDMRQKLLCRMEIQKSVFNFAFADQEYLHSHIN